MVVIARTETAGIGNARGKMRRLVAVDRFDTSLSGLPIGRIDRIFAAMTKTENRAAARAYAREREMDYQRERHAAAVADDLEALRMIRHYLIFRKQVAVPAHALVEAIDDHVEAITRDRRRLHAPAHIIPRSGRPK